MKKLNFLKYGLTALMMAFAMMLCFSCSSDDDEQNKNQEVNPPSNAESVISGTINGHAYVEIGGLKWATENVEEYGNNYVGDSIYGYFYNQIDAREAAASWGDTWQLPTQFQWQQLYDTGYWEWTIQDNKEGFRVYDRKDYSKFIFLPASGYCDYYRSLCAAGSGLYWSADETVSGPKGIYLWFGRTFIINDHYFSWTYYLSVRPVSK